MRRVNVESPYAGKSDAEVEINVAYARAAVRDCLLRGEAPYASHLLYTQRGITRDADQAERALGMKAGLAWAAVAEAVVVYTDHGISSGMKAGITRAKKIGLPVEYRTLPAARSCTSRLPVDVVCAAPSCPVHRPASTPSPLELRDLLLTVGHDVDARTLIEAATSDDDLRAAVAWAHGEHARAQGLAANDPPSCPAWLEAVLEPLSEDA